MVTFRFGSPAVAASVIAALALLSGCGAAQDAVDQAAAAAEAAASRATASAAGAAVQAAVERELERRDIPLEGPPDCATNLSVDAVAVSASGTVTCTATTTNGRAVEAVFDGTLTPTSCPGELRIEVEGRADIDVPRIDGCRIAQVLGGVAEGAAS
jgi:hypothetical protein